MAKLERSLISWSLKMSRGKFHNPFYSDIWIVSVCGTVNSIALNILEYVFWHKNHLFFYIYPGMHLCASLILLNNVKLFSKVTVLIILS